MTKFHAAALASLTILSALTHLASAQTVRYVRATAPAGGNGLSWATAYNTLQPAINVAVAGDEIWVAAGTYTEPSTSAPAAFNLRSGIALYGGFSGAETLRSQRSPSANATVLHGTGNKTVLRLVNVTQVIVDGFEVAAGKGCGYFGEAATACYHPGGGASIDGSDAVFLDCDFQGNTASWGILSTPAHPGEGGAVALKNSVVSFHGCQFVGNSAAHCYVAGCAAGFYHIWAPAGGGGAISSRSSTVDLTRCVFSGNTAGSGCSAGYCGSGGQGLNGPTVGGSGGAIDAHQSTVSVDQCSFTSNSSGWGGGAASLMGSCLASSTRSGHGGALNLNGGSATIRNSLFVANVAPGRSVGGLCTATTGGFGGAVYSTGQVNVINSTFYGNTALDANGAVGGALSGSIASIKNCIFWSNADGTTNFISGQIGNTSINLPIRSIIQGYNFVNVNGNLNLNPLFLNPLGPDNTLGTADDRFDLAITSPAIDAGNNSFYTGSSLDLAGNTRFFDITTTPDTGFGTAPIIDIGPYERSRCPADLDDGSNTGAQDNAVTIDDLLYFLVAFESGTAAADLDNGNATGVLDNAVTIDDLLFFLTRFEIGC
jgi:hypothetical protein